MQAITNWSINSKAKVLNLIHAEEKIHWFYGLRESEMHMVRCEGELRPGKRELTNTIDRRKKKSVLLSGFIGGFVQTFMPARFRKWQIDFSDLSVEIDCLAISIRDSQMQFDAAQQEFNRICEAQKENLSSPYEVLQDRFSAEALRRQQAVLIASRIFSAQRNLPPEVGEILIRLTPEKQEEVMAIVFELLNGSDSAVDSHEALQVLDTYPAVLRNEALIQAAQSIEQIKRNGGGMTHAQ